jgi:hypothetical protein
MTPIERVKEILRENEIEMAIDLGIFCDSDTMLFKYKGEVIYDDELYSFDTNENINTLNK